MSQHNEDGHWLTREFFENRKKFPPEELLKYAGLHVAWSWEGDRIVASDRDESNLWEKLVHSGVDPQQVVFSFVEEL